MKKYRYEIILLIVDAICMILELIASRVLSPYFGNSNFVWTSVIGIILLSGSIGNYFGGKIADKENVTNKLKIILGLSGIAILIIPFIKDSIIGLIAESFSDVKIGAVLATSLLFFLPSFFMGLLTPIIVKLKLESLSTAGQVSGKINAIATIGGITGTFLGGFFLIPNFGSVSILFVLSIILLILILFVDFKIDKKSTLIILVIILVAILSIIYYKDMDKKAEEKILSGEYKQIISYDTEYGNVRIYNGRKEDKKVRVLMIDGGFESATYLDEDYKNELVYEYTKYYDLMFNANIPIKETLMIGGAGYNYPKYFISHYDDKKMDVVEIDGKITEIAKQYFYLDELIEEYNLNENNRLNLITEDGRTYINKNTKKYDAILNDAFSGQTPAKTLTTLEAAENVKKSLNENGVYLTNIISALEGKESKFLKAEVNTLKRVFKNVYVVPCDDVRYTETTQNNMVIATDDVLELEYTYDLKLDENEIIITDDYCPVDTLIPQY